LSSTIPFQPPDSLWPRHLFGRFDLEAKAKSFTAIRDLEHRLRNDERRVTPGGVRTDDSVPGYQLALDLQVHVPPPSDDEDDGKDTEAVP
jgi:hypothetical protein